MENLETIIQESKGLVAQSLQTSTLVQKSVKISNTLCDLAICITIMTAFIWIVKMHVLLGLCYVYIILLLVKVSIMQKKRDICIKTLNEKINEFKNKN